MKPTERWRDMLLRANASTPSRATTTSVILRRIEGDGGPLQRVVARWRNGWATVRFCPRCGSATHTHAMVPAPTVLCLPMRCNREGEIPLYYVVDARPDAQPDMGSPRGRSA